MEFKIVIYYHNWCDTVTGSPNQIIIIIINIIGTYIYIITTLNLLNLFVDKCKRTRVNEFSIREILWHGNYCILFYCVPISRFCYFLVHVLP